MNDDATTGPDPSPAAAADDRTRTVTLDLVVPVYDEVDVLPELFARLDSVFAEDRLREVGVCGFGVVFVDDGSRDESAALVAGYLARSPRSTLLRFSRNFGHQNAVAAGLDHANADVVAVMDADLQDPPETVLDMLLEWRRGADTVAARRRRRKEGPLKVFAYWLFYRLLGALSDTPVNLDCGDFCLMDRRVVEAMRALPERLRFARGLRSWVGFRSTVLEYDRDARAAGDSKYPWRALYRLATDGIVSTSTRPMKLAQFFAFVFALISAAAGVFAVLGLVRYGTERIEVWFLIAYALVAFSAFAVLLTLYVLCGYVGRMYLEVKERPSYIVMEALGARRAPPAARP